MSYCLMTNKEKNKNKQKIIDYCVRAWQVKKKKIKVTKNSSKKVQCQCWRSLFVCVVFVAGPQFVAKINKDKKFLGYKKRLLWYPIPCNEKA